MFENSLPLAERVRPHRLEELVGQDHLVAEDSVLSKVIRSGNIPSMILWGPPGSGKTTLVNLIPRLYDVTEGQILIDGMDIKAVKQHDLRKHIGYIPQKASLFSGTIKSNLTFAKEDASEIEMAEAISPTPDPVS